jgi:O-Antigen ligase
MTIFSRNETSANIVTISVFSMIVLYIATGAYTLLPGTAYLLIVVSCGTIWLDKEIRASPWKYIELKKIYGFAIFNAFFFTHFVAFNPPVGDNRTVFIHAISLGMFVLTYVYGKVIISWGEGSADNRDLREIVFASISVASLALLLVGQLFETLLETDLITRGVDCVAFSNALVKRPGGFFNPNMTAAIALVFLFVVIRNKRKKYLPVPVSIILTATITLLSQSRTAIIVLIMYVIILAVRSVQNNNIRLLTFHAKMIVMPVVLIIAAIMSLQLSCGSGRELVISRFVDIQETVQTDASKSETARAESAKSNDMKAGDKNKNSIITSGVNLLIGKQRGELLIDGVLEFLNSPIVGNGYRYVEVKYGMSTHNEIVENLANYGLVGVAIVLVASVLLYWPFSVHCFLICIFPTFMFSHNFFETAAFQTALGVAISIDQLGKGNENSKKEGAHVSPRTSRSLSPPPRARQSAPPVRLSTAVHPVAAGG